MTRLARGGNGLALLVVVGLAVLTPTAAELSWLGPPLTPAGLLLLTVALALGLVLPALPSRVAWWLATGAMAAALARLCVGLAAPPGGLVASYWVGTEPAGPPERSTEFLWLANGTRVDQALDFDANQFPLHFLNDGERFNFWGDVRPARDELPFLVRWSGYLAVPSDGPRRLALEALGVASLRLEGREVLSLAALDAAATRETALTLTTGLHPLEVDYARPQGRVPRLRISWEARPGEGLGVLASPYLAREPLPLDALFARHTLSALGARGADALLTLVVAWWLVQSLRLLRPSGVRRLARAGLALVPLVFLAHGLALHSHLVKRTIVLSGGDDWLAYYEGPARSILLEGPLLNDGRPFFAQPLYQYVLAAIHLLGGEGLFAPLAVQVGSVGLVVGLAGLLGWRLFGPLGGLAALGACWAFAQLEHLKVAQLLLSENLYSPLVMASLVVLVSQSRGQPPAWRRGLLVGGLLGLTALARSQFLLFVPFATLLLLVAWRRQGAHWRPALGALAALLLGIGLAVAPATARNWIVARQFVPITSSAGANLLDSHEPPPGFDLSGIQRDPLYEALGLDRETRIVVEYARTDPLGYLGTWVPMAAHAIGIRGVRQGHAQVYWPVFLAFLVYLAAFALPRARRREVWFVHAFVLTHLLVMAAFASDTYGYRLVLPMFAPLVVVAAQVPLAAVQALASRLARPWRGAEWRLPAALGASVVVGALVFQLAGLLDAWPRRELAFHGFSGAFARGMEVAEQVGAGVVYVASWDGTPRRVVGTNLPGLRYPRLKWFDPRRTVPIPPEGTRAVYLLYEVFGGVGDRREVAACLGLPDAYARVVLEAEEVARRCAAPAAGRRPLGASFGDLARVDAVSFAQSATVGRSLEVWLEWTVLRATREQYQAFVHLQDEDAPVQATAWGNGTAVLYPSSQWEAGERLLSRLPVPADPTAVPGRYRLSLGFSRADRDGASLTAAWAGGSADRVPIGVVQLVPGAVAADASRVLPRGVRRLATPPEAGGLQLMALRPPRPSARPGERLTLQLVWRASHDAPAAERMRVRLLSQDSRPVQELEVPLLRGKYPVRLLRAGEVMTDEVSVLLGPRVPEGRISVVWDLLDASGKILAPAQPVEPLVQVQVEGRRRQFALEARPAVRQQAVFGERIGLEGYDLQPRTLPAGDTARLRLYWRALREMEVAYKVFTHVLDQRMERVIAQHDDEPMGGRAPTTGWLIGEFVEDEYRLAIARDTPPSEYPVEVGFYDPRDGARLMLHNGDHRLLLSTRLRVVSR